MKVTLTKQDNLPLLKVEGSISADQVELFQSKLDEVLATDPDQLVIDLSEVQIMCSMGIGVTSKVVRSLRKQNGKLVIVGANEDIRKLFEVAHLDKYIELQEQLENTDMPPASAGLHEDETS